MRCSNVREQLPAGAEVTFPSRVNRHLARCAECRAEAARYEELSEALGHLAAASLEPPADLRPALIAIARAPRHLMRSHLVRNRRAYVKGVAVAAAGMVGALAVKSWARHPAAA